VEYEVLQPVLDPEFGASPEAPLLHPDLGTYEVPNFIFPQPGTNVSNHFKLRKGDVDSAWSQCAAIVERKYRIPHVQHVPIEPHVAVAKVDEKGKITLWGSSQSPFAQRNLIAKALHVSQADVQVIAPFVGGGFGCKAGLSMEALACAIATKVPNRPVKLRLTREEEFFTAFVRQGLVAHFKMGCDKDGKLIAVIAVDISADAAVRPISNVKIGKTGFSYIMNKDGLVLSYPDKTKILQLNVSTFDFGKEILQKKNGLKEYSWEGKQRLASFQEYPAMGWIIVSVSPKAEILESTNAMRFLFIVLVIVMALFSLITGIMFTIRLVKPINRGVTGITEAANQVTSASIQVSSSSQHLAEGASQQASSLEETSASLEEMSSMTKQNADNASQARAMMIEAKGVVEKANGQMAQLTEAIGQITKSSEETGKIIKTIDEIAFQTNLLALNAAVEAARAGEAGAGFAVVADEVRNLALRSAEAAKNTSELIEKTIKAVKNGNEITIATQTAFRANAEISGKIGQLVEEIATASQEQAHGIGQVNTAVSEMDKVTQQTAANAEESAAAAEEMNAQAQQMKGYVEELAAVVGGSSADSPAAPERKPVLPGPAMSKEARPVQKARKKAGGDQAKALIPFDEDDKGDFKDF